MEINVRAEGQLLPQSVLTWVEEQAGRRTGKLARVEQVMPMQGGISSAVYALEISLADDKEHLNWVLRQFTDKVWLQAEPDLAEHETAALQAAKSAGIQSPEWIAADPTGERCGLPMVLMSRLPGKVVLPASPSESWIRGLAEAAAAMHGNQASMNEPIVWNYFTYNKIEDLQVPAWTTTPSAWAKLIERVNRPAPNYVPRLIHRDYHPANVLWLQDRVSGVVDWVNACQGPAGIDTGHCRLNLVQLYGVETADAFMEAYLASPGSVIEAADPYWDILTLIEVLPGPPGVYKGWEDLGFQGLTAELIEARLDAYAERLANEIGLQK